MRRNSKTQKGFAALEGILILVIVGLIAGTGWYVMKSKNQADKANNSVAQSTNTKATPTTKSLNIKEWGVKAPYEGKLHIVYQVATQSNHTWADFSSTELNNSDSHCTTDGANGGVIIRMAAGEHLLSPVGEDTGQSIEEAISSGVVKTYSHVGNYYYYYQQPQANCSDSESSQNIQSQTSDAVKVIAASLVVE